jgi:hypothetical protein
MNYFEGIEFLNKEEEYSNRETLNDDKIKTIKLKYKNIPEEYLDYLKHIGWGSFLDSQFMIYEELMTSSELDIEAEDEKNNELIFFGDNFSGDIAGFNLKKDSKVIEWWQETDEIHETGQTFSEYIREQMGINKK